MKYSSNKIVGTCLCIHKTILILFSILIFGNSLFSQSISINSDSILEKKILYDVKQLDQFIGRFNLDENIYGDKYPEKIKDSTKALQLSFEKVRKKVLLSLFNSEYYKKDSTLIKSFINKVTENSKYISFYNNNWLAEVNTTILLNGNEKNVSIILQIEKNNDEGLKWVIRGVKAGFLDYTSKGTYDFINPISHETYFIDLRKVFENKNHTMQYAYKGFKSDELSIFLYLISQNMLLLKHINSITYHFLQIDNYVFTIDFFNRSTLNSGWLVSHLMEVDSIQKHNYLYNKFNID